MDAEEVTFAGAGVRLAGAISWPRSAGMCLGVVLIGGSGPSDRHNDGFFDPIRDHLAAAGVAVLAYDKRGAGKSTGAWAGATVDDLARDAAAAVAVLRSHPGVAADNVGVLGHSEGGWVALPLAAGHDAPAHLILNSCPAVSFAESEVFPYTLAGASPDAAGALMRRLTEAVRAGRDYQEGPSSARTTHSCLSRPASSDTSQQPPLPVGPSGPASSPTPTTGCRPPAGSPPATWPNSLTGASVDDQWHSEYDDAWGGSPAEVCETYLTDKRVRHGLSE